MLETVGGRSELDQFCLARVAHDAGKRSEREEGAERREKRREKNFFLGTRLETRTKETNMWARFIVCVCCVSVSVQGMWCVVTVKLA